MFLRLLHYKSRFCYLITRELLHSKSLTVYIYTLHGLETKAQGKTTL